MYPQNSSLENKLQQKPNTRDRTFRCGGAKSNPRSAFGFEMANDGSVVYARVRSKFTGKIRKLMI